MKFSMNGFRRNLHCDVERLRRIISDIVLDKFDLHYDKEDLINAFNEIVTHSNVINCVYVDGDKDFTDMSTLSADHIDV